MKLIVGNYHKKYYIGNAQYIQIAVEQEKFETDPGHDGEYWFKKWQELGYPLELDKGVLYGTREHLLDMIETEKLSGQIDHLDYQLKLAESDAEMESISQQRDYLLKLHGELVEKRHARMNFYASDTCARCENYSGYGNEFCENCANR
jgi:hypothetical protein